MKRRAPANSSEYSGPALFRRKRVHPVENADRFEYRAPHDFQALWAEFVDGVLRSMPEDIVVAVIEINQIGAGDASLDEWNVIVGYLVFAREKVRLIAETSRRFIDHLLQPWS